MRDSLSRWERAGVRDLDGKETANNFRGSAYCRPLPNPLPEGEGTYFMRASRLNARMVLLLLSEAMLLFGGLIVAVYLRLGAIDAEDALIQHRGFYKAALATIFCLAAFYLLDLYDFVVMHDRRELVLRLLQALGLAWVALALLFYALPQAMIGRGVSLISLPLALMLMVGWRLAIHWVLGHPEIGERILIVGSGNQPFGYRSNRRPGTVGRQREHRSDRGSDGRPARPVSNAGTSAFESFGQRFHRRERVVL